MGVWDRVKPWVVGKPRDIEDPRLFHKITLAAFLAWVGLGADGLSSSSYGPDEAFRALGEHRALAVFLALATAVTISVVSFAYSRTIEHFPTGGGGYLVATKLLGAPWGVVSGCALLVDYVLTITVSLVSGADQIFSFLPPAWQPYKLPTALLAILLLVVLNLRGVKESIEVLMPIFLLFLITHITMLGGALICHARDVPAVAREVSSGLGTSLSALGVGGMFIVFARAYARGAGTYTGIEAVSNGMQVMREPRIATAQRTMIYMAISLSVTSGGILLCYMLLKVRPEEGRTLNAVLLQNLGFGHWFLVLTLAAEAALLLVAAQTGFIDGPRVMANMALDSWLPHSFSALSERFTMYHGILLMGAAGVGILVYAAGDITVLVTMYAINVFITFSLTQLGMCRFWFRERGKRKGCKRGLAVHGLALVLCAGILGIMIAEKFYEGAWVTLAVTAFLVVFCFLIRRYYDRVKQKLGILAEKIEAPPEANTASVKAKLDPTKPIAALLVSSYGGLGAHALLAILKLFPSHYKQVVFVSVSVLDSGNFKGAEEVDRLQDQTEEDLKKYVALANRLGLAASSMTLTGIDPVAVAEELCIEVSLRYPNATFFAGQLIFEREKWYHRLFHNETAYALQRRLQWHGLPMLILPVRVWTSAPAG